MGLIPRDPTQGPLRITGKREGGGTYGEDLGFSDSWAPATGYFWPDGPNVGRSGRWVFTLTAGPEWGCFAVSL